MAVESNPRYHSKPGSLRWQSQAVLLAFVPLNAVWVTLVLGTAWNTRNPILWQAAALSIGFAIVVFLVRAATAGAVFTGTVFTASIYLQTPGWTTGLWPLLALFLLTFAATRFGKKRKEALGTAEGSRGRTASQVAANLGVAALAGIPLSASHVFTPVLAEQRTLLVAMIAALAEATADTVSSELGQVLGGEPRLITTLRRVPAGTDGGITAAGTLAGCAAAAAIAGIGLAAPGLTRTEGAIAMAGAVVGLFVDSLLGALMERRGWLNNDAVNALSTLAAALTAAGACRHF